MDDAHAAENYIAAFWSLLIDRSRPEHATLHTVVSNILKPLLDSKHYARLMGKAESISDIAWVDKLPTPDLANIHDELIAEIDTHISSDLSYSWSVLRDHILACQLYMTTKELLIRPLRPPTWTHSPFVNATQRIFMSATLGAGGDLERLTGRRNILRLPVPEGWDRQGIGRRYFIFPDSALEEDEAIKLRRELMQQAGRSLVLVPSDRALQAIVSDVEENLKFKVFGVEDLEASKDPFVSTPQLDFPHFMRRSRESR